MRRLRAGAIAGCLILALAAARPAPAQLAERVESVTITVSDMERAIAFYTEALAFQIASDTEVHGEAYERLFGVFGARIRVVRLRLGRECIELMQFMTPRGRPIPADSRSNDRWFQHIAIVVSDMDAAYRQLRAHDVAHVSPAPQRLPDWNPNAGGISAFYFRDPDGNNLELIAFPPGKGEPRWQAAGEGLFLGIDHTAIAVRATAESLGFFHDTLGLAVAGRSENYGPEQERLNSVFAARLLITGLRAAAGPGVELLEYLAPTTGRAARGDTRVNDLWHWHVSVATADIAAAEAALRGVGAAFVSPSVVAMPADGLDLGRALMVRSPAGHGILVHGRR